MYICEKDLFPVCQRTSHAVTLDPTTTTFIIIATAVALVLVTIAVAVGGVLCHRHVKHIRAVEHAPKDEGQPFTAMFVSLKKESQLWEMYGDHMHQLYRVFSALMVDTVAQNKCYLARQVYVFRSR